MSAVRRSRPSVLVALGSALALILGMGAAVGSPNPPRPLYGVAKLKARQARQASATPNVASEGGEEGDDGDPLEVADQAAAYAGQRSAPADSVSAQALIAARRTAATLPSAQTRTREVTNQPMDAEPAGYNDPYWSNAGAGFRHVAGRMTALAVDGADTYYAGAADGGVWKSTDAGRHWTSIWDKQDSLSIGSLLVAPDHSLWVGTGESNTSSDSYLGTGVYRSTDGGKHFVQVGGSELVDSTSFHMHADGSGYIYDATSKGLYRHSATTDQGSWTLVLKPDPNPSGSPYLTSFITDVAVQPGTDGQVVLAALGWRNGSSYNGFYLSTTGGGAGSFTRISPAGIPDTADFGRTTLAYAADGSRLYAIIQSPDKLLSGEDTNLQGVYVSRSGSPQGPWKLIADSKKLGRSGSALKNLEGYHVGIQSWYNQALAVDPTDPMKIYVSLEEVFQSDNGGKSFTTASPYWNYGLACGTSCPPTTHPDQHALAITTNKQVVIGNDGGVYSRPENVVGYGSWNDRNDTLFTLQYYDAAAGGDTRPVSAGGGIGYWGGLQDNGTTYLPAGASTNLEPAGGDGGMVIVDPRNPDRAVGEYTNLAMYRTSDGGHTFTTISPECGYYTDARKCDPSARFIAPFQADIHDTNHWVAAGNKVWDTTNGWDTVCSDTCDWQAVHSFGKDAARGLNVGTALAVSGVTTYAAWVDSSGNPSPNFQSGIDTNYGGSWHRIASPVLPNRYISGLTVDPSDPAHVYAIFNGYSRRWIPGGGLGTVFESTDGGSTWQNVSGNLPDAPGDGLAIVDGTLVLATDVGLFTAQESKPTRWSRVAGLPNAVVNNVRPLPGQSAVVVAMHGRGIWRVSLE